MSPEGEATDDRLEWQHLNHSSTVMLDPKHLQAFVVLAQEMHFGRTAKRLGISQPTLSGQIRALEEEIGGAIINRSNRTMTLTVLGETFLADAQKILAMMECAKRNTADVLDGTVSSLRIGVCPGTISSGILRKVLTESRRRFPKLEVAAVEAPPATLLSDLTDGRIDLMIGILFSLEMPKNTVVLPIARCRGMLAVPADRTVTDADGRIDVNRVSEETFFLLENQRESPHVVEHVLSFRPQHVQRLPSARLIADYIACGLGVAVMPETDAALFDDAVRLLPIPDLQMPVGAVRLAESNSPTMIRFCRMLRELFGEDPGL